MVKKYLRGVMLSTLAVTLSAPAFAASIASQADALMPAARQIADPYRRGVAEGWLDIATRQDGHVLMPDNVYHDAAQKALGNARYLIDGSVPFRPIYTEKHWPTREKWAQAIRQIEDVDQREYASSCRSEAGGKLLALTDEIWKEQDETHGTHWVHGWEAIERAQKLSVQVNDELAHCAPPPPPPVASVPLPDKPITLAADALFDFDSATLKPAGQEAVGNLAQALQKADAIDVMTVIGYTDRFGSVAHNRDLSYRRARAVADALKAQGVNPARFDVRGAGSTAPVATCRGGKTPAVIACLAPNRRVEIRVSGTTSRPVTMQQ